MLRYIHNTLSKRSRITRMKKGVKISLITFGATLGVILIIIGSFLIYLTCSPNFVVNLLRKGFGGSPQVINTSDYQQIKENVKIYKDLEYPSSDDKNKYDIYLPNDVKEDLPTIVWAHGGAFVAGSKDGIENYAVMLANEGYTVVGVDYEWAPEIKYPGQVRQIEECLQQLKNVQTEYHLNLDNIVLVGDSAGAHIAAQAVLLATNPEYEKALGVKSAIDGGQLKGAILYCGPYDVSQMLNTGNNMLDFFASRIGWALFGDKNWKDGEMIKTTTIKDYATSNIPPCFITDGNSGSFESQGKDLAEYLDNLGVSVTSLFFEKDKYGEIGHEYQFNIGDDGAGAICYKMTLEFLESVI